jgi:hypothetical protein
MQIKKYFFVFIFFVFFLYFQINSVQAATKEDSAEINITQKKNKNRSIKFRLEGEDYDRFPNLVRDLTLSDFVEYLESFGKVNVLDPLQSLEIMSKESDVSFEDIDLLKIHKIQIPSGGIYFDTYFKDPIVLKLDAYCPNDYLKTFSVNKNNKNECFIILKNQKISKSSEDNFEILMLHRRGYDFNGGIPYALNNFKWNQGKDLREARLKDEHEKKLRMLFDLKKM